MVIVESVRTPLITDGTARSGFGSAAMAERGGVADGEDAGGVREATGSSGIGTTGGGGDDDLQANAKAASERKGAVHLFIERIVKESVQKNKRERVR